MMGPAIYDFRLFRCLTSKMAPMRQIKTTGQCLLAHFQIGPTSAVNRLTNSVKRSITPPAGQRSLGDQLRCSPKTLEQESCNGYGTVSC
jgi:hypothetical protein